MLQTWQPAILYRHIIFLLPNFNCAYSVRWKSTKIRPLSLLHCSIHNQHVIIAVTMATLVTQLHNYAVNFPDTIHLMASHISETVSPRQRNTMLKLAAAANLSVVFLCCTSLLIAFAILTQRMYIAHRHYTAVTRILPYFPELCLYIQVLLIECIAHRLPGATVVKNVPESRVSPL